MQQKQSDEMRGQIPCTYVFYPRISEEGDISGQAMASPGVLAFAGGGSCQAMMMGVAKIRHAHHFWGGIVDGAG